MGRHGDPLAVQSDESVRSKLLLSLYSFLFVVIILLLAEFIVRLFFPGINFQGTERHLVREHAFGSTFGWQPDATGVSFGTEVRINHEGFRDIGAPATADSTLLLIGDSVLFGVGVEAESTFAGRVQHAHPQWRVINTGAVGYSVHEYADVATTVLRHDPTIRRVLICYSLNDFYGTEPLAVGSNEYLAFFRNYSKLYLWLKNILFDRSKTYFEYDFGYYERGTSEATRAMTELVELVKSIEQSGLPVTVVLIPYEYQVRMKTTSLLLPQEMIRSAMKQNGIPVIDLFDQFAGSGVASRELFLYGDHMHLSSRGHAVVAATLDEP